VPQPFWEDLFRDAEAPTAFGPPSAEIVELASLLPAGAAVLDLGCGDGRNALTLAAQGFRVHCVDISPAALEKLERAAAQRGLRVETEICDLREFHPTRLYNLTIAHGCLHLVERIHHARLLEQMQAATAPGGYNVVVVFNDSLDAPEDLRPFVVGLFPKGWLFRQYSGWEIVEQQSYILEDEHPGGIRHRHAIDKLVARRAE
jgi:tellurite methyltransferase